jgi:hypothetical protein
MESLKMKNNGTEEIRRKAKELLGRKLIGMEYCSDISLPADEDFLKLVFFGGYTLKIQTFWRIIYQEKIFAVCGDRNLLPAHIAPEKDFQHLPYRESALYESLLFIKEHCLNSSVKEIVISDASDITICFDNSLQIQALIHCRCKSYFYYGLYQSKEDMPIFEVMFEK